jgi:osmotically-inducible protein OsmY
MPDLIPQEGSRVVQDFRINALVRAMLVRLSIDLAKIEHGATNGVVYVKGTLRTGIFDPSGDGRLAEIQTAHRLERALRGIPGVRDVVFQLDRVIKVGRRWELR